MANSIDIVTGRVQHYLTLPLIQRCAELRVLIDELSINELQHVFPMLINSIFGLSGDNVGWGLHTITLKRNPQEFEVLSTFLGPVGPIFTLCYKLLPDCYLKYNFPVSYLPAKIRLMLEEGIIPPFYSDKLKDDSARPCTVLCMNPFEYYIFHFAFHLTNPWLQMPQPDNIWTNWETVYFQLANVYLLHFLPLDDSPVLPIIGPYIKKTPPRKLMQSPDTKRMQTSRLLRSTILNPNSTSPESGIPQQQQCLPQVWRSETILQVFLDFWIEYTEDEHSSPNGNPQICGHLPRRNSIYSGEHIMLVRQFIKTLHQFANSATGDRSAMDELKRVILPSVQGKIYIFLRKTMEHWPLDTSFKYILEAWLSFIQPWRYVARISYSPEGKVHEEARGKITDPSKWISFVANNLLAYTAIFQQLLPRFMRTDLVAPKNAAQLFRVTKVFSQPHLAKMLQEIENSIDDVASIRNRSTNQWTLIVRQQILELEGPSYQYVPMFSQATTSQVVSFLSIINQAYLTSSSLVEALEKQRTGRRFFLLFWEFLGIEDKSADDVTIEDRQQTPNYLECAQQHLIEIFQVGQINVDEIPYTNAVADREYHESVLQTSHCHSFDSGLDSSRPGVYVPVPDGRQNCRYIEYMGDPELQPVRSYECAFLVRLFYRLCNYFNTKYQRQLATAYHREDFVGRITRQILRPPTVVVQLPKRTPQGFSCGYEKQLPPCISFRSAASYNFMCKLVIGMLIFWLTGYGTAGFIAGLTSFWTFYILIKAISEPWRTTRHTADSFHRLSHYDSYH